MTFLLESLVSANLHIKVIAATIDNASEMIHAYHIYEKNWKINLMLI